MLSFTLLVKMNSIGVCVFSFLFTSIYCSVPYKHKKRTKHSDPEKQDVLIEPHYSTTKDGYILELHRVQWTDAAVSYGNKKQPVAFLMHGLFGSSKEFTHLGLDYSIAYNLAESGMDVWLGNIRGTSFSRHHIILNHRNPLDWSKFFNYGFDEISKYDMPAMLDYILRYTNSKQLHYIGHSQGCYYLFMLLTVQPEYAEKIQTVHLLGCAGSLKNVDILVSQAGKYLKNLYQWGMDKGIMELSPMQFNSSTPMEVCITDTVQCDKEIKFLIEQLIPAALRTESVSMKQLAHYGQMLEIQDFKSWDQGSSGNLMLYGTLDPIHYNFSAITAPTTIYFSTNDILTSNDDVKASKKLRPSIKVVKITDPLFSHVGFLENPNVKRYVTNNIVKAIFNTADTHPGIRFLNKKMYR